MSSFPSSSWRSLPPLIQTIPGPIAGVFLVGLSGITQSLAAELEVCQLLSAAHARCLSEAMQREKAYLCGVIDFQEPIAPFAPALTRRDMRNLSTVWSIDRLTCVVVCNARGEIVASRNYRLVEQTQLQRTLAEFDTAIAWLNR